MAKIDKSIIVSGKRVIAPTAWIAQNYNWARTSSLYEGYNDTELLKLCTGRDGERISRQRMRRAILRIWNGQAITQDTKDMILSKMNEQAEATQIAKANIQAFEQSTYYDLYLQGQYSKPDAFLAFLEGQVQNG